MLLWFWLDLVVWCIPEVQQKVVDLIERRGEGTFLVSLKPPDLSKAKSAKELFDVQPPNKRENFEKFVESRYRQARGEYVFEKVWMHHQHSKDLLLSYIDKDDLVSSIPISNSFVVRMNSTVLEKLKRISEIAEIHSNEPFSINLKPKILDPVVVDEDPFDLGGGSRFLAKSKASVQWNIAKINVPVVWGLDSPSSKGQGVIYGIADTGVDYKHPAIRDNYLGRLSKNTFNHNYAWYDGVQKKTAPEVNKKCPIQSHVPCDDNGHGTHTLSTAIGADGIGVAPEAKWIACRNMDNGVGSPETYLNCLNFFLAPHDLNGENPRPELRPHVVGNSYGCPNSEGCTKHAMKNAMEALRAAGVFMSVSAGNEGPACSTVKDPPALEKSAIVVGAVDSQDKLASFSARGPVTIVGGVAYRKPDLTAPGVAILGAYPGTSMASPHVSGAAILMTALCPCLSRNVDQLQYFLQMSAVGLFPPQSATLCGNDKPTSIPNNYFGWGRIDVLAAVNVCRQYCANNKKLNF